MRRADDGDAAAASEVAARQILLPALIGFGAAALVVIAATRGRLGLAHPTGAAARTGVG